MTDEYAHIREAFHTVADGLMDWRDPPPATARVSEIDVEAIERLSDAAIRSGDTQTAIAGYSLALRLRGEMRKWVSDGD